MKTDRIIIFAAIYLLVATQLPAADLATEPFISTNQQPTLKLYGFPVDSSATITATGKFKTAVLQEIASDFTFSSGAGEQLIFDGESYRTAFLLQYGLGKRFEAGLNIPYQAYSGGFLDSFIIDWHNFFGMPQGSRNRAQKGAVNYSYRKDGVEKLRLDRSESGIGDISLTAGYQLFADEGKNLAIRGNLKLPTGESGSMLGSGSTDLTLSLCGSAKGSTSSGDIGAFGSLGVMAMTDGRLLADQQKHYAVFGTIGGGWNPASWIAFKLQLNASSPIYRESSLKQLSSPAVMLMTGGTLNFPGDYRMDLGVAEDISVATAPDVTFHLSLSKTF